MNKKKFIPPLELGGPWEGLGTETPVPSVHSLSEILASKHYLMKKYKKNTYNSGVGLQPSPPTLEHECIL
jgi:hypothetical protein